MRSLRIVNVSANCGKLFPPSKNIGRWRGQGRGSNAEISPEPEREEMSYQDFLNRKRRTWTGTPIPCVHIPEKLFPFQRELVRWALHKGRCALWADTGLGKSAMLLAWAENIRRAQGRVLVLAPLAVVAQTVREGVKFGIPAVAARSQAEADA